MPYKGPCVLQSGYTIKGNVRNPFRSGWKISRVFLRLPSWTRITGLESALHTVCVRTEIYIMENKSAFALRVLGIYRMGRKYFIYCITVKKEVRMRTLNSGKGEKKKLEWCRAWCGSGTLLCGAPAGVHRAPTSGDLPLPRPVLGWWVGVAGQ